jgi:predicted sulfurtransferase
MNPQIVAAMILIPVLCGCDGSSAEDTAPMKSATYYTQNLQEANQVAGRCKLLDERNQRELSVGDYQEWQISNEGVNCQTAVSVSEAASVRDFVLKQSKPAATPTKLSAPSSAVPAVQQERAVEQKITSNQALAP